VENESVNQVYESENESLNMNKINYGNENCIYRYENKTKKND